MAQAKQKKSPLIVIAALGVVYGDIGTSPLYALRVCFNGDHAADLNPEHIYGILSLISWSLIIIVTLKYLVLIMRADNQGEGGILALMQLVLPEKKSKFKWPLIFGLGLFGAALLYGDGILTPAISVLSALEGLEIVTPIFIPYVVPITVVILLALFWLQSRGTGIVGRLFGPVMLLWFISMGVLGLVHIIDHPAIFKALNPIYAVRFFLDRGLYSVFTLGAVFLVVTGGEAMYADLGHFGLQPIRKAWFAIVLPGLLLNYFGQGALLIQDPGAAANPFFFLAPDWGLIPLIIIATAATIIASQAIISGVFSLTFQAVQLNYLPRLRVVHTSASHTGRVYLPRINFLMMVATIAVVLMFRTSANLAGAYGIAIVTTMVITDILALFAMRTVWKWGLLASVGVTLFFIAIDLGFFASNIVKIIDGGWFPLLIAFAIYAMFRVWVTGRRLISIRLSEYRKNLTEFIDAFDRSQYTEVDGTAIYLTGEILQTPLALHYNLKHNHVIHKKVMFLEIGVKNKPYVSAEDRLAVDNLGKNFRRVLVKYGFLQEVSMRNIVDLLRSEGILTESDPEKITYFLAGQTILVESKKPWNRLRNNLFRMLKNSGLSAIRYFDIPDEQVFEIGIQLKI